MVAQPHVFVDQLPDIGGKFLAGSAAALEQDAADDADGPFAMFLDLGEILLKVCRYVLQVSGVILVQLVRTVIHDILQVVQQLGGHLAEIDYKIQRILYFVGDAGTENTQGGHLFLPAYLLPHGFQLLIQIIQIHIHSCSCLKPG